MSVRQYVISDPPNITYKQTQNDTTWIPSTVWQQQMDKACMETQNIIHSDHPYLYKRNKHNNDSEPQFRALQTIEGYNPQYYDPEYGKDQYWDDELYDKTYLQFRNEDYPPTDDEIDPDIMDNTLSRALIEPWHSNFEATSPEVEVTQRPEDHKGPTSLLDETAFLHLLVVKEGEPSYVPLSTNLGLKFRRRMLYFPMDFGELTLDGLIDTGAHSSAIPETDLRKIRLLNP